MKKLTALLLVLCMVLALCACGSTEAPAATEAPASEAETTPAAETPAENADGSYAKPDGYPNGNISWIVPGPAGAALDVITRALSDVCDFGGNVVIENIAGATHTIGHAEAASRPGDGLTMLTCSFAGMIIKPATTELTYDMDSFRHIAMMAPPVSLVVCVSPNSDIKNADDWISAITSGDRFTYSHSSGVGGIGHLACMKILPELGSTAGEFVAYNGSAEMLTAVLNGEIDWALIDANEALTKSKSGELTPIVTFSSTPWEGLEDVPCITEFGVDSDYLDVFMAYKWVAVPKDTPDDIVNWLSQQINAGVQNESYRNYLVSNGLGTLDEEWTEEDITQLLVDARGIYEQLLGELGMLAS